MLQIRPLEWFLAELVLFILLWIWDDYIATYLSLVFGAICLAVLVIALLAEWFERSKVPRSFFLTLAFSVAAPILAAIIYLFFSNGQLSWLS